MSVEVLLIRHAESEMNQQPHLIGGRSNWAELTDRGREQASVLGAYLKSENKIPDVVISSPAVRTQQTAELSLKAMGIARELIFEDQIQELDQGEWEGMLREKLYTPEVIAQINQMNGHFSAPGGESPHAVAQRMHDSLHKYVDSSEPDKLIHVYTHGFAIRILVGRLLDWPYQQSFNSVADNTSVTTLIYDGAWSVKDFARVPN